MFLRYVPGKTVTLTNPYSQIFPSSTPVSVLLSLQLAPHGVHSISEGKYDEAWVSCTRGYAAPPSTCCCGCQYEVVPHWMGGVRGQRSPIRMVWGVSCGTVLRSYKSSYTEEDTVAAVAHKSSEFSEPLIDAEKFCFVCKINFTP